MAKHRVPGTVPGEAQGVSKQSTLLRGCYCAPEASDHQ